MIDEADKRAAQTAAECAARAQQISDASCSACLRSPGLNPAV